MNMGTMFVMILPKCRPVARAKLTRCPPISVTTRPSAFFPTVACHSELSISAWYSQVTTRPTVAARKMSPMIRISPASPNSLRMNLAQESAQPGQKDQRNQSQHYTETNDDIVDDVRQQSQPKSSVVHVERRHTPRPQPARPLSAPAL